MRLPSLKYLKTFHVAATRLSFKAAAAALFITPSAVSHQIRTLEEQLGITLFVRGPRALTLTDAGSGYLEQIDSLFRRLESVTEQLQVRFGRAIARLHVPPFFASELLRVDTMFAAAEAAEKGLGIALVSVPLGLRRFENGSLVRLFAAELDSGDSYFLLHRAEDGARREVQALKSWLLDEFRANA